jgi:hypothetical protein
MPDLLGELVGEQCVAPVEGIEHLARASGHPPFVHIHGGELAQVRSLFHWHAADVVGHDRVGTVQAHPTPVGDASGDGGFPGAAAAADPVGVAQPLPPNFEGSPYVRCRVHSWLLASAHAVREDRRDVGKSSRISGTCR